MVRFIRSTGHWPTGVRLRQSVLDIVRLADHVEAHLTRPGGVAVTRLLGNLDAVKHGLQQVLEELPRSSPVRLVDQLRDREPARAVHADEQARLAFGGLHLGNIDVD